MMLLDSTKDERIGACRMPDGELADPGDAMAKVRRHVLKHPLSDDQIAEYHEKGYIHLKNVFSPEEVADLAAACEDIQTRNELIHPDNVRFETYENAEGELRVWKADPISDLSPVFAALTRSRRILDPLASIYEGREAFLFKDKLIYKPPGGRGSDIHQDYNWWQGFPTSLISVMVAIDPADEENGCTQLMPGHKAGLLTKAGEFGNLTEDMVDMSQAESIITDPGDIALFHCHAPHVAGPNESDRVRRQIFLTYNDSQDGDHYQSHRAHYLWYVTRYREEDKKARTFFI